MSWGTLQVQPESGRVGINAYTEARHFLEKQKWGESVAAFSELLRQDPRSLPYAAGLATAMVHLGRREAALDLLVQMRRVAHANYKNGLVRKVRVLSRLFLTNKTFQLYQDGMNLVAGQKFRNAMDKLEKALLEEPDNVEILTRLGQCLVMDNDLVGAVSKLEFAKKLNPFEPEISLWLGRAKFLKGNGGKGGRELWEAYEQLKGSETAVNWLAEDLWSTGQVTLALRILESHARAWPYHIETLITLARYRSQLSGVPDIQNLWGARKSLQLAMSRMDHYLADKSETANESGLGMDLRKSDAELKNEIQRLLQQIQNKIDVTKP